MLWIITKDEINKPATEVGVCMGAMEFTLAPSMKEAVIELCNFEFRLFDDDANLYYEGVCKDLDQQDGDGAFEPVDYYMNSCGVTYMEYRKKGTKQWQTL